jgi:hypothetical protein
MSGNARGNQMISISKKVFDKMMAVQAQNEAENSRKMILAQ